MTAADCATADDAPPPDDCVRADVWVVSLHPDDDLAGRLGDARDIADRCGWTVGALQFDLIGCDEHSARSWIHAGADAVLVLRPTMESQSGGIDLARESWRAHLPRLILTSADRVGRAWSARLAARTGWRLVCPALLVHCRGETLCATQLDGSGRRARPAELPAGAPAIVALRPGVAQPLVPDVARRGQFVRRAAPVVAPSGVVSCDHRPADPQRADIRHVSKLIAGGRGVGGPEGFGVLRRIAVQLGAGVAASRMAVDLGWIEPARQVGQTGKTVRPDLYIACGISGASHHLEGMSESRHIVAINSDPQAPLMQRAELALQADLHATLGELASLLESTV